MESGFPMQGRSAARIEDAAMRSLRTGFRLCRVALHLLWAVVTVACAFPFLPISLRRALKVRWSRQLLQVLGVQLRVAGVASTSGGLVVCNHISWLDIYAINALLPANFVAKAEVHGWPIVGWLGAQTETIFLQRRSHSAAMRAKQKLVDQLRRRSCIVVFPEATTGSGDTVLPFHSALFQSSIDAGVEVQPLVMRYLAANGTTSAAPVYIAETSLWQSLLAIARADSLTAHLDVLPTLDPTGTNRRQLAMEAREIIARRLAEPIGIKRDDALSIDKNLAYAR